MEQKGLEQKWTKLLRIIGIPIDGSYGELGGCAADVSEAAKPPSAMTTKMSGSR